MMIYHFWQNPWRCRGEGDYYKAASLRLCLVNQDARRWGMRATLDYVHSDTMKYYHWALAHSLWMPQAALTD